MAQRGRLATVLSAMLVVAALCLGATAGWAAAQVEPPCPADFPVILDASLGVPVIGFGAAGRVTHTPVIFLHGNNDTPFPTVCNPFGHVHDFAEYFAAHGYTPAELWG